MRFQEEIHMIDMIDGNRDDLKGRNLFFAPVNGGACQLRGWLERLLVHLHPRHHNDIDKEDNDNVENGDADINDEDADDEKMPR